MKNYDWHRKMSILDRSWVKSIFIKIRRRIQQKEKSSVLKLKWLREEWLVGMRLTLWTYWKEMSFNKNELLLEIKFIEEWPSLEEFWSRGKGWKDTWRYKKWRIINANLTCWERN